MDTRWVGRTGLALLVVSLLLSMIGPLWFPNAYWDTTRFNFMGGYGMMGRGMPGGFAADVTTGPFDQRFLDQMIIHHQGAVVMAQSMIADSPRPEMRDLAQRIITAQQREIAQMRRWRQDWYGSAAFPYDGVMGGMMGGMMNRGQMGAMMGADFDVDRLFLQMMIPHHEGAIAMAEQALKEAEHNELKTLSQSIITSQSAEIEEMQGYLQEWYGGASR